MTIEVANESGVGVDELALVSVARYVLDRMGINPLAELSVLLMDVDAMTELHVKWMDEPGPTDVMSFPMDELDTARRPDEAGPGPALLGDVVLCPAVAAEQATPGRAHAGRRTAPAHRARRAAPARLRPRRARRGTGDVPAAERTARRLARQRLPARRAGWPPSTRRAGRGRTRRSPTIRVRAVGADPPWTALDVLLLVLAAALVPIAGCSPPRTRRSPWSRRPGSRNRPGGPARAPRRCWPSPRTGPGTPTCCCCCGSARAHRDRAGRRGRAVAPGASSSGWRSCVVARHAGGLLRGDRRAAAHPRPPAPVLGRAGRRPAPTRALARVLSPIASLLILIGNAITPGRGVPRGPVLLRHRAARTGRHRRQTAAWWRRPSGRCCSRVFDLGDTIVREVMVPRTEMVWIEETKTLRQALHLATRSGLSRIPVIGEDVDDVLGVVYLKDLIARALALEPGRSRTDARPRSCARRCSSRSPRTSTTCCARCSATAPTSRSWSTSTAAPPASSPSRTSWRRSSARSPTSTTLETPAPVEHLADGSVRVSARLPVEDLGEIFDVELPAEDVETVGGLLAQLLGRVPLPGSEADDRGLHCWRVGVDRRGGRVQTVLVRRSTRG